MSRAKYGLIYVITQNMNFEGLSRLCQNKVAEITVCFILAQIKKSSNYF